MNTALECSQLAAFGKVLGYACGMKRLWGVMICWHFILLVLISLLSGYAATYVKNCFGAPICDDGIGCHVYLPSILIHHDFSFGRNAEVVCGGRHPDAIRCANMAALDKRSYASRENGG